MDLKLATVRFTKQYKLFISNGMAWNAWICVVEAQTEKKYVIERMALEKAIRLTNKHESEIDRKKKEEEEIITEQAENVAWFQRENKSGKRFH